MESDLPKVPKQAEAKRDGVINPQKNKFQSIFTREILMLSKRYESTEVDRRTWLHVPSGPHWSTRSDTHQEVKIYKETSCKMFTPFEYDLIHHHRFIPEYFVLSTKRVGSNFKCLVNRGF